MRPSHVIFAQSDYRLDHLCYFMSRLKPGCFSRLGRGVDHGFGAGLRLHIIRSGSGAQSRPRSVCLSMAALFRDGLKTLRARR